MVEVILGIKVAAGPDGVTHLERAGGFKSEWASLLIPMPKGRAIWLRTAQWGGYHTGPKPAQAS